MKKTNKLLFVAALIVISACGNVNHTAADCDSATTESIGWQENKVFRQNCDYLDSFGIDCKSFFGQSYDSVDIAVVDCVANVVRTLDFQMEPYNDLPKIKKELSEIKDLWFGFAGDYHLQAFWEQIMWNRVEFHLSNPLTFQKWEPSSKGRCLPRPTANINSTPLGTSAKGHKACG
jgi:hypothetical protein